MAFLTAIACPTPCHHGGYVVVNARYDEDGDDVPRDMPPVKEVTQAEMEAVIGAFFSRRSNLFKSKESMKRCCTNISATMVKMFTGKVDAAQALKEIVPPREPTREEIVRSMKLRGFNNVVFME